MTTSARKNRLTTGKPYTGTARSQRAKRMGGGALSKVVVLIIVASQLRPQSGFFLPFMGFLLMTSQAFANHLHQARIQNCRQCEVLIEASLPAQSAGGDGLGSEFGQAELLEGHAREIQRLRAAVVGFSVDTLLIVATGVLLDAVVSLLEQHGARAENHSASGTDRGASRLQAFIEAISAQLAFGHSRVVALP